MKKQKFTYYMHSSHDSGGFREFLKNETNLVLSEEAINKAIQTNPFYEIGLDCEIDEKGNITILGIKK